MNEKRMAGKTVLVTGAAGGIGSVVAESFLDLGAKVIAVDHNKEHLEKWGPNVGQVYPFEIDITDEHAVGDMVAHVEDEIGAIDILVNVAGMLHLGEVETLSKDDWEQTFGVNTTGLFLVSKAVSSKMKERQKGSIVTVSSNAGRMPRMSMAAYAASKAAATMFTKCLGLELSSYGIRCNVVSPGSTETDMLKQLWTDENGAEQSIKGTQEAYRLGIPLQKLGQAEDIAEAVLFLASDHAGHMTMQDVCIDGGATLGV
ncbi:2,3-dihydro-2,3-dihydroxybenzoate dehydrogenase [Pontibacillus sp. ALD_SL1]|uniref:2,3-dihydro-2,3-dihydroxybenzoate dehydrogenase n=1 Tax=Pontibacillus sp. ALD_SL1 TaxID=2777185 RepID=UPI001A95E83D|nr:2,3-dihydro-2,3-dihydroxybenzoate dehydrogenase [Pontibacillus sp. ALD_SL1]QST01040.1 2,3-dihydro-2,3-dihydroxybenzoate dehydrogenase [Pontibacillus sp. ALD_SL1]